MDAQQDQVRHLHPRCLHVLILCTNHNQTSIDSESDSEGSTEYDGVEDLQCALRCWQCGEEEHGEVIDLPPGHDGAEIASFFILSHSKLLIECILE